MSDPIDLHSGPITAYMSVHEGNLSLLLLFIDASSFE